MAIKGLVVRKGGRPSKLSLRNEFNYGSTEDDDDVTKTMMMMLVSSWGARVNETADLAIRGLVVRKGGRPTKLS